MTDEHQGETVDILSLTPEQIAVRLSKGLPEARELLTITWGGGDVIETGSDGLARPSAHGTN